LAVCKQKLAAAVDRAKAQGQLTDELARLGLEVARGYLSSGKFTGYSESLIDDILGAWSVNFVRKWHKLDPEQNCFAWITYMVRSAHFVHMRSLARLHAREEAGAGELLALVEIRKDDWGRVQCHLRYGDDEGIVSEADWLARVRGST
jgi:hypothetical protein